MGAKSLNLNVKFYNASSADSIFVFGMLSIFVSFALFYFILNMVQIAVLLAVLGFVTYSAANISFGAQRKLRETQEMKKQ